MASAGAGGRLTTHVLDTARGRPAAGLKVELLDANGARLAEILTNEDGRADRPLLEAEAFEAGAYELRFHVGDYFRRADPGAEAFYEIVPVPFVVSDPARHIHVPLLLSPFGYSTYRGS